MSPGIVAVDLQQIDLVGGRVVAHVVRGHSLDADREAKATRGTTIQAHSRRLSTKRQISQLSGTTASR